MKPFFPPLSLQTQQTQTTEQHDLIQYPKRVLSPSNYNLSHSYHGFPSLSDLADHEKCKLCSRSLALLLFLLIFNDVKLLSELGSPFLLLENDFLRRYSGVLI